MFCLAWEWRRVALAASLFHKCSVNCAIGGGPMDETGASEDDSPSQPSQPSRPSVPSAPSAPSATDEANCILEMARAMCARIHEAGDTPSPETIQALRSDLQELSSSIEGSLRQNTLERARFISERDLLLQEVHAEQVDREANISRIAERQRFLFERQTAQSGQATAADRAVASASYVEAALASLCPHVTQTSPGCSQLHETTREAP